MSGDGQQTQDALLSVPRKSGGRCEWRHSLRGDGSKHVPDKPGDALIAGPECGQGGDDVESKVGVMSRLTREYVPLHLVGEYGRPKGQRGLESLCFLQASDNLLCLVAGVLEDVELLGEREERPQHEKESSDPEEAPGVVRSLALYQSEPAQKAGEDPLPIEHANLGPHDGDVGEVHTE